MRQSLILSLYLGLTRLAEGPAERWLRHRLNKGKEHPDRWREKLGHSSAKRPNGPLIWMHAASVGESVALLDLIGELLEQRSDANVLVTSGTQTSADLLADRLPDRAQHQFAPIDAAAAVRRFLAHWKPDVAVWTESELWPRLICDTSDTGCPMFLINARMSQRSARRLRWARSMPGAILRRFKIIMAQDDVQADKFNRLGMPADRIEVTGSLKDMASALPHDPAELKQMTLDLAARPCWLAASTHEGEEEATMFAHRAARRVAHGLVLILAPRHPERGEAIANKLRAEGWRFAQRSKGEKLARDTEVYLADTLGEMGLWYRLAPISFVGGSLAEVGGHNPFEAAHLGSAILHGGHVHNFAKAYERFDEAGAAVSVANANELGQRLIETLSPDRTAALATAGWQVASEGAVIVDYICGVILSQLPKAKE